MGAENPTVGAPWDCQQTHWTKCIVHRRYRRQRVIVGMSPELLTSEEAAHRLGISVLTLYDWLTQSDAGTFEIRGQAVTIAYFQGGRRGQGRIKIEVQEIERLLSLMRVAPKSQRTRNPPNSTPALQHITTKLGRPDD